MWALIYPGTCNVPPLNASHFFFFLSLLTPSYLVCTLPLLFSLFRAHRRAKNSGSLQSYKSPYQLHGGTKLATAIFWQLDTVGIILIIGIFAMILVPFTIAGGVQLQWKTAKVIAPLVIGVLLIPVWIVWESKCEHPMVPFKVSARGDRIWLDWSKLTFVFSC